MKKERRFTGTYADDGPAKRLAVREAAGHRCIRCQHPFESGKHGRGEWSPCDERCTHEGPFRFKPPGDDEEWQYLHSGEFPWTGEERDCLDIEAKWRVLTVHHLDGDKANDAWSNTLALCQRCHLQVQTTVDPRIPWFLEHSDWFKPYAAGFYAKKYEGREITRKEAMERLDELLAYEFKTA